MATLTDVEALLDRDCASDMVKVSVFVPVVLEGETVALYEKMLSPAVASPFVPSSYSVCVVEPPMAERLPVTVIPVLVGFVPGVTVTVRSVASPTRTVVGFAAATPVGGWDVSSLVIVPMPCPLMTLAPLTFVRFTKNISSGSIFVSPLIVTLKLEVLPEAMLCCVSDLPM